jgi:hypothetical protein
MEAPSLKEGNRLPIRFQLPGEMEIFTGRLLDIRRA